MSRFGAVRQSAIPATHPGRTLRAVTVERRAAGSKARGQGLYRRGVADVHRNQPPLRRPLWDRRRHRAEEQAVLLEDGEDVLIAHELTPGTLDGPIYFVDGVRRTDFRVHDVLDSGMVVRGLAGSFGVGAVCCTPGVRPGFVGLDIQRRLLWTHGHAASLPPAGGWQWQVEGLASTDADQLLPALQRRMRDAEADLAGELAADGAVVVRDGPLNRLYGISAEVVGLVKSHHKTYLPVDKHREVPTILARPGQRTSLFRLRDEAWGTLLRLRPTVG